MLFLTAKAALCQIPSVGYHLEDPTFLDATIDDYDVFFTTEWHWHPSNTYRMKHMISYLAERKWLDAIVVERSYDFGHWVNHFLETGDSLLLKEFLQVDDFFSHYDGTLYQDEYKFYVWLRAFSIENKLSIRVIGLDLHAYWDGKPMLWSFLKFTEQDSTLQDPLQRSITKARELMDREKVNTGRMLRWHRQLKSEAGDADFPNEAFAHFLFSLQQAVKYARGCKGNCRENRIAENFQRYIKEGEKVYGQFAHGHTMLHPEDIAYSKPFQFMKPYVFYSLAYRLNTDDAYKDKVISAGRVCFSCNIVPSRSQRRDIYEPYISDEDFERLRPRLSKVPNHTFVDLRGTGERTKQNCQLLLVEFD